MKEKEIRKKKKIERRRKKGTRESLIAHERLNRRKARREDTKERLY
jgi:hypothetical protein